MPSGMRAAISVSESGSAAGEEQRLQHAEMQPLILRREAA